MKHSNILNNTLSSLLPEPKSKNWASAGFAAVGAIHLKTNYKYYFPGSNFGTKFNNILAAEQELSGTNFEDYSDSDINRYGVLGITPNDIKNDVITGIISHEEGVYLVDPKPDYLTRVDIDIADPDKFVIDCTSTMVENIPQTPEVRVDPQYHEIPWQPADFGFFKPDVRLWLSRFNNSVFSFSRSIETAWNDSNPETAKRAWLYITAEDADGIDKSSILDSVRSSDRFACIIDNETNTKISFNFDLSAGKKIEWFNIKTSVYKTTIDPNKPWESLQESMDPEDHQRGDEDDSEYTKILKIFAIPIIYDTKPKSFGPHNKQDNIDGEYRENKRSYLKPGFEYKPRVIMVPRASGSTEVTELNTTELNNILREGYGINIEKFDEYITISWDASALNNSDLFTSPLHKVLETGDDANLESIYNANIITSNRSLLGINDIAKENLDLVRGRSYVKTLTRIKAEETGITYIPRAFKVEGMPHNSSSKYFWDITTSLWTLCDDDDNPRNANGIYQLVATREDLTTPWAAARNIAMINGNTVLFGDKTNYVYRRTHDENDVVIPPTYEPGKELFLIRSNNEWIFTTDKSHDFWNKGMFHIRSTSPTGNSKIDNIIAGGDQWNNYSKNNRSNTTQLEADLISISRSTAYLDSGDELGILSNEDLTFTFENDDIGYNTTGDVISRGQSEFRTATFGNKLTIGDVDLNDTTDSAKYINVALKKGANGKDKVHEFTTNISDEFTPEKPLAVMLADGGLILPKASNMRLKNFEDFTDEEVVPKYALQRIVEDGLTLKKEPVNFYRGSWYYDDNPTGTPIEARIEMVKTNGSVTNIKYHSIDAEHGDRSLSMEFLKEGSIIYWQVDADQTKHEMYIVNSSEKIGDYFSFDVTSLSVGSGVIEDGDVLNSNFIFSTANVDTIEYNYFVSGATSFNMPIPRYETASEATGYFIPDDGKSYKLKGFSFSASSGYAKSATNAHVRIATTQTEEAAEYTLGSGVTTHFKDIFETTTSQPNSYNISMKESFEPISLVPNSMMFVDLIVNDWSFNNVSITAIIEVS